MKLTKSEIKTLIALVAKKSAGSDLTRKETREYNGLKSQAENDGLEITEDSLKEAMDNAEDEEEEEEKKVGEEEEEEGKKGGDVVTESELREIVQTAVASAPSGTVDTDGIVKQLKTSMKEGQVTKGQISEVVKSAIPSSVALNDEALSSISDEIKKGLDTSDRDEKLVQIVAKQFSGIIDRMEKSQSKMTHKSEGDISHPISHRSGNLSVAEKQLLNIVMADAGRQNLIVGGSKGAPTDINDGISEAQVKQAEARGVTQLKSLRNGSVYGKSLTTGTAGFGQELLPVDLSSTLMARMYLESQIAAEFISSEIEMPSNPFRLPLTTTRPQFFQGLETSTYLDTNVADNSRVGTGEITLDARKFIGSASYSYEVDEDAIIAILPMLQEQLSQGAADSLEDAILNGDVSQTHMDADIAGVAQHSAKNFTGLRKSALNAGLTVDLSAGGITGDSIASMRKKLQRFGVNRPQDLMIIAGPCAYNDLVALEDLRRYDSKGGNNNTINTGVADNIFGIPIVVSAQMRENHNASGVFDGVDTTKGSLLMVHRPSWILGVKRGFLVEVDSDKRAQANIVVASFRRDFKPKEAVDAVNPSVVAGINYNAM